jgi:small GTP-binding protein
MNEIKILIIGDSKIGKSSLISNYLENNTSQIFSPNYCNNNYIDVILDNQKYTLNILDVSSSEEFEVLRHYLYKQIDLLFICYSIDDLTSYYNIEKWIREIKDYNPIIPKILVGLKEDLKTISCKVNKNTSDIFCKSNNFLNHFWCSSHKNTNIIELFDYAIKYIVESKKNNKSNIVQSVCCTIL